jgi:ADP-heptose:LPS heptosyltransferase
MEVQWKRLGIDVTFDWVVRDIFADLLKDLPLVRQRFIFNRRGGLLHFVRLVREIRRHNYDLVLDLQGLARSALLTFLARGKRKLGRRDGREGSRWFCPQRVDLPEYPPPWHALEILKKFLGKLELREELEGTLEWPSGDWHYSFAPKDYDLLFPDSRRPEKCWPHFVELADALCTRGSHAVVCAGSHVDQRLSLPHPRCHNLTGQTSLSELPALVRNARCVVANDSGPMHLAAALRRPTVALFGPTDLRCFGPYPTDNLRHRILYASDPQWSDLSVEHVTEAVLEIPSD